MHLGSARRVLDQLHQLVAEDHLARCDGHVLADRVRIRNDLPRHAPIGAQIMDEVARALGQGQPAGLQRLLDDRGISRDEVGRSQRVDHQLYRELGLLFGSWRRIGVAHDVKERFFPIVVDLSQPPIPSVLAPCRVGKAPVLAMLGRIRRSASDSTDGCGCGRAEHFASCPSQSAGDFIRMGDRGKAHLKQGREHGQRVEPTHQVAAIEHVSASCQNLGILIAHGLVNGVPIIIRAGLRTCCFTHQVLRPLRRLTVTWRSA